MHIWVYGCRTKSNTRMTELTTVAAPKGAQDALEELVRKMYISNVSKRLRELNQPTVTETLSMSEYKLMVMKLPLFMMEILSH